MASPADMMPELVLVRRDRGGGRPARPPAGGPGRAQAIVPRHLHLESRQPAGIDRSAALAGDPRAPAAGRRDFPSFGIRQPAFRGQHLHDPRQTRRDLVLPGLTVHIVPGPGPQLERPAPDSRFGQLYLASDPRRFLENLTRGRGWSDRVLPQPTLEAALDRILMVGGPGRLNNCAITRARSPPLWGTKRSSSA